MGCDISICAFFCGFGYSKYVSYISIINVFSKIGRPVLLSSKLDKNAT